MAFLTHANQITRFGRHSQDQLVASNMMGVCHHIWKK